MQQARREATSVVCLEPTEVAIDMHCWPFQVGRLWSSKKVPEVGSMLPPSVELRPPWSWVSVWWREVAVVAGTKVLSVSMKYSWDIEAVL